VCESSEYAWQSAAALCAGVPRDIVGNLTPDYEWRIDVSDEVGKALFSFRFVARRARKAASAARQCPVTEFTRAQAAGRSGELSWE
jgi:hypothetical protein